MSTELVMSFSAHASFVQKATPGSLIFWKRKIHANEKNPNVYKYCSSRALALFINTLQRSSPWNPPATIKSSLTAIVLIWTLDRVCDNSPGCSCKILSNQCC